MKLVDPIIAFQSELQQIRRDLHAHPELCYEEQRTSDVVAAKLTEWGIPVIRGLGKTGVVGIIKNGSPAAPSACAPTWTRCPCRK
jgi:hippurate hydrolase